MSHPHTVCVFRGCLKAFVFGHPSVHPMTFTATFLVLHSDSFHFRTLKSFLLNCLLTLCRFWLLCRVIIQQTAIQWSIFSYIDNCVIRHVIRMPSNHLLNVYYMWRAPLWFMTDELHWRNVTSQPTSHKMAAWWDTCMVIWKPLYGKSNQAVEDHITIHADMQPPLWLQVVRVVTHLVFQSCSKSQVVTVSSAASLLNQ